MARLNTLPNARLVFSTLALVATAALSLPVHAQAEGELARAREAFLKGARAAESGSWHEAERNFREAYEISGRESPLFNWALSLKELGRIRESAEQLDNLLRIHKPDSEMRAQAREMLSDLKKRLVVLSFENLERKTVYVIRVRDRDIFDGGERPLEVFAEPGLIRVSIRAENEDNALIWERDASGGSRQVIDLRDEEVFLPSDEQTPELFEEDEEGEEEEDDDAGVFSSPVFWLITGVVVAAGAGVGVYLVADANADLKPESGSVLRVPY